MLTDTQKEPYEKLQSCQNELTDLLEREAFTEGFCLAVKIMMEVVNTMEIPSVGYGQSPWLPFSLLRKNPEKYVFRPVKSHDY